MARFGSVRFGSMEESWQPAEFGDADQILFGVGEVINVFIVDGSVECATSLHLIL